MLPRGRLATILPDVEAEERTLRAPEAVVTVPAMEALFAACTGWLSPMREKWQKPQPSKLKIIFS